MIKRIFTNDQSVQETIESMYNNRCNTVAHFKQPITIGLCIEEENEDDTLLGTYYKAHSISLVFDQMTPGVRCEVAIVTEGHSINTKVPKSYFGHCIECELVASEEGLIAHVKKGHSIMSDPEYIPVTR